MGVVMRSLAAARAVSVVRCRGAKLVELTASVSHVRGRAAVALVVGLAAACVSVPAARAISISNEIVFQANTGTLWTWTLWVALWNTGLGMMAGTSPSVASYSGLRLDP